MTGLAMGYHSGASSCLLPPRGGEFEMSQVVDGRYSATWVLFSFVS